MAIPNLIALIALSGVATEFGIVMLIYLKESISRNLPKTPGELKNAVLEGVPSSMIDDEFSESPVAISASPKSPHVSDIHTKTNSTVPRITTNVVCVELITRIGNHLRSRILRLQLIEHDQFLSDDLIEMSIPYPIDVL